MKKGRLLENAYLVLVFGFLYVPIAIYSMTKKKVSPEINALSAIMFVVILTIILAANAVDSAKERRLRRAARAEEGRR